MKELTNKQSIEQSDSELERILKPCLVLNNFPVVATVQNFEEYRRSYEHTLKYIYSTGYKRFNERWENHKIERYDQFEWIAHNRKEILETFSIYDSDSENSDDVVQTSMIFASPRSKIYDYFKSNLQKQEYQVTQTLRSPLKFRR